MPISCQELCWLQNATDVMQPDQGQGHKQARTQKMSHTGKLLFWLQKETCLETTNPLRTDVSADLCELAPWACVHAHMLMKELAQSSLSAATSGYSIDSCLPLGLCPSLGHLVFSSDLSCPWSSEVSINQIRWRLSLCCNWWSWILQLSIDLSISIDNKRHYTNVLWVQDIQLHHLVQILVLIYLGTLVSPFFFV